MPPHQRDREQQHCADAHQLLASNFVAGSSADQYESRGDYCGLAEEPTLARTDHGAPLKKLVDVDASTSIRVFASVAASSSASTARAGTT